MSPEQASGEPVDHRADLFSLGSVLYALCTGRPPFRAETTMAVLRRVSDDTPRPIRELDPEVPDWLEAIVARSSRPRTRPTGSRLPPRSRALARSLPHAYLREAQARARRRPMSSSGRKRHPPPRRMAVAAVGLLGAWSRLGAGGARNRATVPPDQGGRRHDGHQGERPRRQGEDRRRRVRHHRRRAAGIAGQAGAAHDRVGQGGQSRDEDRHRRARREAGRRDRLRAQRGGRPAGEPQGVLSLAHPGHHAGRPPGDRRRARAVGDRPGRRVEDAARGPRRQRRRLARPDHDRAGRTSPISRHWPERSRRSSPTRDDPSTRRSSGPTI